MKKILVSLLIFSINSEAQVSFKWLGISNFILSDQKTTIMFDPAISRPTLMDHLPFQKFKSDAAEVDYWLKRCNLNKLDAIFVNHTHYDHASDASFITKKFGNKLFGSSSLMKLGEGQGVSASLMNQVKPGDEITIGDFKVKIFNTPHAAHILDIMFMDGNITEPVPVEASVWDYKVGDAYSFVITHPKGTILFQAIGGRFEVVDPLKNQKADVLLLTIANRKSTEELIEKRIIPTGAKKIIPLHHDNFFFPMKRAGEIDLFWGIKLDDFKEKTKKFSVYYPTYCEENILF